MESYGGEELLGNHQSSTTREARGTRQTRKLAPDEYMLQLAPGTEDAGALQERHESHQIIASHVLRSLGNTEKGET